MRFSPQPRAYFRHLNFKKWSRTLSFLTFSLPNVLFATAACNFWCILSAPTSAPAALTGLLFDWPDTRIYEKTQHFVTSLTFSADVASFFLLSRYCRAIACSFCWLLSADLTTLLRCSTFHIVGSFYLNFLRLSDYCHCMRIILGNQSPSPRGKMAVSKADGGHKPDCSICRVGEPCKCRWEKCTDLYLSVLHSVICILAVKVERCAAFMLLTVIN